MTEVTNSILYEFEQAMLENGRNSFDKNVPTGFTVTDSGKFFLKFSKVPGVKVFESLSLLMEHVIELKNAEETN